MGAGVGYPYRIWLFRLHRLSYTIWYAFLSCHYIFLSIGRHTPLQLHCITLCLQSCIVETA